MTLELHPEQLKAILKQAISANPAMVEEVLKELKEETSSDEKFDRAVDDIFNRYDDVFRALA
jgi:hypothetical protein